MCSSGTQVGVLDSVDEVHVARCGVGGPRVARRWRVARNASRAASGATGELAHERHRGDELIWFPDPVGARECELVATGVELLVVGEAGRWSG